jgi:hypothetical protein
MSRSMYFPGADIELFAIAGNMNVRGQTRGTDSDFEFMLVMVPEPHAGILAGAGLALLLLLRHARVRRRSLI